MGRAREETSRPTSTVTPAALRHLTKLPPQSRNNTQRALISPPNHHTNCELHAFETRCMSHPTLGQCRFLNSCSATAWAGCRCCSATMMGPTQLLHSPLPPNMSSVTGLGPRSLQLSTLSSFSYAHAVLEPPAVAARCFQHSTHSTSRMQGKGRRRAPDPVQRKLVGVATSSQQISLSADEK